MLLLGGENLGPQKASDLAAVFDAGPLPGGLSQAQSANIFREGGHCQSGWQVAASLRRHDLQRHILSVALIEQLPVGRRSCCDWSHAHAYCAI